MGRNHAIYWYQEEPAVADAFLFNCRDNDLRRGGTIPSGSIILGVGGFVVAERTVAGLSGTVFPFRPTRRCEWKGHELNCMVHPQMPISARTKAELRPYNYLVAELEADAQFTTAQGVKLPVVITPDGRRLVNLECGVFQKQGNASPRRAKLI